MYHSVARGDCLIHHRALSKRYIKSCQIKTTQTFDCQLYLFHLLSRTPTHPQSSLQCGDVSHVTVDVILFAGCHHLCYVHVTPGYSKPIGYFVVRQHALAMYNTTVFMIPFTCHNITFHIRRFYLIVDKSLFQLLDSICLLVTLSSSSQGLASSQFIPFLWSLDMVVPAKPDISQLLTHSLQSCRLSHFFLYLHFSRERERGGERERGREREKERERERRERE